MLITKIRKKTHYIIWGFVILFFVSIFYLYGMDVFGGGSKNIGKKRTRSNVPNVVLTIDGKEVKSNEFFYKFLQLKQRYESMSGKVFSTYPMQMFLKSQTADMIINQQIMLDEAKKRHISVGSTEMNKRIQLIQQSYLGPAPVPGDAGIIARTKNYFNEQERRKQFKDIISRQGITYDFFKQQVRTDLLQEKVSNEIGESLLADEKKAALEKAKGVIEKLKTGEPFENVAKEFSDDESTKDNGGQLGWTRRGTLTPAFEKAAFALKRGEISQPVETEFGFHIIQLIDKKEASGPEFDAEEPKIIDKIQERKGDETYNPTPEEIKNEYEQINTRHILIRYKDKNTLASEWLQRERKKGAHKIEIVNPELKAYRYLNKAMLDKSASPDIDYDKAMKLYQDAIAVDEDNQYLYYEMGKIYEMKNRKAQYDKLMASLKDNKEEDPYAEAMSEADTAATGAEKLDFELDNAGATATESAADAKSAGAIEEDPNKYLPEALEMYQKAIEKSESENVYRFDALLYIAAAEVAAKLDKKEVAIENYKNAIDFSAGNVDYLNKVKEGLEKFSAESEEAKKALDDANELIDELNAEDDYYPEQDSGQETSGDESAGDATEDKGAVETPEGESEGATDTGSETENEPVKSTDTPQSERSKF